MSRIMIIGDTHCNHSWLASRIKECPKRGIDRIYQLGDFGIWDHHISGIRFLDIVNETARSNGIKVHFIDGNHDNHQRLDWYQRNNPRTAYDNFIYIRSHVRYIPRGTFWDYSGIKFSGVGGAYSVDKLYRAPGTEWWPGEQLTDSQLERIPGIKVDVLLTHDAPTVVPVTFKNDIDSNIHRQRMDILGKRLKPTLWFHGHMHCKMQYEFPAVMPYSTVYGLACDGMRNSWGILDTDDMSFKFEQQLGLDTTASWC